MSTIYLTGFGLLHHEYYQQLLDALSLKPDAHLKSWKLNVPHDDIISATVEIALTKDQLEKISAALSGPRLP